MSQAIEFNALADAVASGQAWLKKHKAEASLLRVHRAAGGVIHLELEWNKTLDRMPVVQCGLSLGCLWLTSRFSDHAALVWLRPKNA